MVQQLRALVAFAKDPGLDPSTTICNFSLGVYDVFFCAVHIHAGKTLLSIK